VAELTWPIRSYRNPSPLAGEGGARSAQALWEGEGGVSSVQLDRSDNRRKNTFDVLGYFVVPEAKYAKSGGFEKTCPRRVVESVLTSVDFYNKPFVKSDEIDDVGFDRDLSTKFDVPKLTRPKCAPKGFFGISAVSSKLSCLFYRHSDKVTYRVSDGTSFRPLRGHPLTPTPLPQGERGSPSSPVFCLSLREGDGAACRPSNGTGG